MYLIRFKPQYRKMLKRKLKLDSFEFVPSKKTIPKDENDPLVAGESSSNITTSKHFATPFWKQYYDIECSLNQELKKIVFENRITHIYNPIEYAKDPHCDFLKKYLSGSKKLVFVGMNPGPNGMVQTGIPFGNIRTVRDWMKIEGEVEQPDNLHPKRPIKGLNCDIEEPSGVRLWGLFRNLSTDLNIFARQCFIANFCPLAFFDSAGRNITPSELKGPSKDSIRNVCLKYLQQELILLEPEIVVAIGNYVDECLKRLPEHEKTAKVKFLKLAHPSPRSLNNTNWPEKAETFLRENDLLKYVKSEE